MQTMKLFRVTVQPGETDEYFEEHIEAFGVRDAIERIPEEKLPEGIGWNDLRAVRTTNEFTLRDGSQAYFVTVYAVGQEYGGPEEGGWWYTVGSPVKHVICHEHEVVSVVRALREEYPDTGKRSSVVYGEDFDVVCHLRPGKGFPEARPHYE
jgi:hypothetical protein